MSRETTWICDSNTFWETSVRGTKGDTYRVTFGNVHSQSVQHNWSCTCKGFIFNRTCRHIDAVKTSGKWCGWNKELEILPKPDSGGCPNCGGTIRGVLVDV